MAVRLVRQSSYSTPTISNKDDVRMIRYAYGGYNGILKGFGKELSYRTENQNFIINPGRVVLDGWEVDIEDAWSFSYAGSIGTSYYSVYLEVDAYKETAEIKQLKDTENFPEITAGEDLTVHPWGVARLLLYHIKVMLSGIESLTVVQPSKKVDTIPYLSELVSRLGFKTGDFTWEGGNPQSSTLYKQGRYVIGNISNYRVINLSDQKQYTLSDGSLYTGILIGRLPSDMLPSSDTYEKNWFTDSVTTLVTGTAYDLLDLKVDSLTGECYISIQYPLTAIYIKFGYEIKEN